MTNNIIKLTRAKIDHLPLTVRLLVVFVLGVCAGLSVSYGYSYILLYFFLTFCAVALTAKVQLLAHRFFIAVSWVAGSVLVSLLDYQDLTVSLYFPVLGNSIVWILFQSIANFSISSYQPSFTRNVKYWQYIFLWLLIFIASIQATQAIMIFFLVAMLVVRVYQLFFIDDWSESYKKYFIFSIVFPCSLYAILFTYAHYQLSLTQESANKILQQVLAYQQQHGSYPDEKDILINEDRGVRYYVDKGNNPYLFYREDMNTYCINKYDFEKQKWDRFCRD